MLLIQSDMFKALWFMVFPIVVFLHGPVDDKSDFCKISGFFLAIGMEASDIAIFMIAVHSALYIFKPRSSGGEGGLYPYRRYAYIFWVVFPLLTASLAFLNNRNSYVAQGTYCYLPVRPYWYRLALAWIPRYVVFLTILVVYVSIYYYVRHKFHAFEHSHSSQHSHDPEGRQTRPQRRVRASSTPALASHGLIPEPRRPSARYATEGRKHSSSTIGSFANFRAGAHRFMWTAFLHSRAQSQSGESAASPPSEFSTPDTAPDTDSYGGTATPQPISETTTSTSPSIAKPQATISPIFPTQYRNNPWRDNLPRRLSLDSSGSGYTPPSSNDIFTVLNSQDQSPEMANNLPDLHLASPANPNTQVFEVSEMIRTREKIRRQLRFLFIYPLVYIGMWIVPFVFHILQFNDRLAADPPFAVGCITTICVCSQGAVDCWLFSTREKPWRHIPGSDGTFFGSLKFWSLWTTKDGQQPQGRGPGKTRNEMAREARAAYRRRDEELAQRRFEASQNNQSIEGNSRRDRSWWDVTGIDGMGVVAMTPVAEEISNPMDDYIIEESNDGISVRISIRSRGRERERDEEMGLEKKS
ncbi:G protein-coupled receptor gpr1 [Clarireedia jacksonii]